MSLRAQALLAGYVRGLEEAALPYANFGCIPEAPGPRDAEGLMFRQVRFLVPAANANPPLTRR